MNRVPQQSKRILRDSNKQPDSIQRPRYQKSRQVLDQTNCEDPELERSAEALITHMLQNMEPTHSEWLQLPMIWHQVSHCQPPHLHIAAARTG